MSEVTREMPRYKCHKVVWAFKIGKLEPVAFGTAEEADGGYVLTPEDEGYGPFRVDREYMQKHQPQVGGYYVVYADSDGYKSFSPAAAFEAGYTLIE